MKFSLKTFLFTMCGVGAVLGIMGKLLLESPENFVAVLMIGSTILPFMLAVGTIIVMGLSGQRRWNLVAWGCFLLVVPFAAYMGQAIFMPTGNPVQLLTTRRLIERRLPQQIEEPWAWQELKRRLDNGRLTGDDVTEALEALTLHMKTTRPTGWNQPLSWQRDFLVGAISGKLVTDNEVLKLCDAYFGPQPIVKPIAPAVAGQSEIQVEVEYGNPWVSNSGLGVELLWNVKKVELDGKPMKATQVTRFVNYWHASCNGPLPAGDHELKIEVECAYADEMAAKGMYGSSNVPTSQWPKTKKRWTTTVTAPVKVSGAEEK